jgi:hypothetical protein
MELNSDEHLSRRIIKLLHAAASYNEYDNSEDFFQASPLR